MVETIEKEKGVNLASGKDSVFDGNVKIKSIRSDNSVTLFLEDSKEDEKILKDTNENFEKDLKEMIDKIDPKDLEIEWWHYRVEEDKEEELAPLAWKESKKVI